MQLVREAAREWEAATLARLEAAEQTVATGVERIAEHGAAVRGNEKARKATLLLGGGGVGFT